MRFSRSRRKDQPAFIALLTEQLAPINDQLKSIDTTVKQNSEALKELKVQSQKITALDNKVKSQAREIQSLRENIRDINEKLLAQEVYSRRDNLQFHGIDERRNENCKRIITEILDKIGFTVDSRTLVRAHRLGPYRADRVRPILIKFHHPIDREAVWNLRHDIADQSHCRIAEDFPPAIAARRRKLFPICDAAYKYQDPNDKEFKHKARVIVDKLILDGEAYTVDTLDQLPDHLQPAKVYTPSNETAVCFFTSASPLSNHYLCDFKVDGQQYNCMEQYIMQQKALAFDDTDIATKVMQQHDPVEQKKLGRKVANFEMTKWEACLHDMLMRGIRSKFFQVEICKMALKDTGNKTIGEATLDKLWGIGMTLRSPHLFDIEKWPVSGNIMGRCLQEVRKEIKYISNTL